MTPPGGRSVSLYDVLGVEPDATAAQIKAAWRSSTDKFEPGQGSAQFRLFNDAADVLLDPERRAAYDAELAGETDGPEDPAEPAEPVGSDARAEPAVPVPAAAAAGAVSLDKPPSAKPAERSAKRTAATPRAPSPASEPDRPQRRVPPWLLAVLAVATVAALVAAAVLYFADRGEADDSEAGTDASAAAERALPAVLSYDYRQLKTDRNQAMKFLSKRYGTEYAKTFDKLIESSGSDPGPAVQAKAVVKATVEDAGVVTATDNRARVIVFLNQNTRKGTEAPTLSLNRLVVSMVRSGNQWLIDDITSY